MSNSARRRIGWALVAVSAVLTIVTATDNGPAGWLAVAVLALLVGIAILV